MTPKEIKDSIGVHYNIVGGGWLNLTAGNVTDDTQMTLLLGDSIIQHKAIIASKIADNFVKWMYSNPSDIGLTVRSGLNRYLKTRFKREPLCCW